MSSSLPQINSFSSRRTHRRQAVVQVKDNFCMLLDEKSVEVPQEEEIHIHRMRSERPRERQKMGTDVIEV